MPIKIFSAPGDHRNDFQTVETQVNEWMTTANPTVVEMQCTVNAMGEKRDLGAFMLTIVVRYE